MKSIRYRFFTFMLSILILFILFPGSLYSKVLPKVKLGISSKHSQKTNIFIVEIAKSPEEKSRGLMYRKTLEEKGGMLFVFDPPQNLSFWMKDTYLDLAIIFIDKNLKIVKIFYPRPLSTTPIYSSTPCKYALEILKSSAEKYKIRVGDKIVLFNQEL